MEGIYTVKVKLYDTALNEAVEKTVEVFVDKTAPKIEKMLVEEAVKYQASATGTKKYYLTSSAYSSSAATKVTLDLEFTEKTSGIYEITLGSDAALTSDSKVLDSAGNQITNVETVGSTTIRFTNKSTAPRDDDKFTLKITNISLGSYTGSREIVASVKDYATLADNNFKKLSFAGDSALYDEIWMDASNISRSAPDAFTVTGKETGIEGYTKTVNLDASLTLPIITESGVKKIKLSGLKANSGATGTKIYKGSTTTTPLGYQLEDDGATIVLNYPIVNTSNTTTLNFTGLELTSLTEGSNSLSAKYEFLTGWESPAKTTTVIYDTVAPVIGSSTESMTWVVKDDASEIPGVSSSATINGQYLVIPVTETNSGVRKIKIEVKKENTEGNMVATTAASCASVAYVGYGTAGTSRVGATTLSSSYWSKSGNELTILDPVNYGKAAYYYIRGIKISDTTSVAEGNYTLHVTLYDYAGNVSGEKTIDMCNDHTSPVVKDTWFDGVVNNASSLSAPRTYTTHSENNTLFIKVEEGGSGIQTIYLHHYFGWDPYNNTLPSCRTIATTSNTKLYKSLDNGATFTEVPCTTGGTSPSYYLKVSNENAIRSTAENDVILKITGLEILATDYADRCAASVSVYMYDFAQNQSSWDTTHNNDKDNPTLAAIAEDRDQADIDQATLTITDSEKVLQGENLVAESGTYTAYTGYTNNPLVNIKFVANEYQHRPSPTSSGIRAFVLEGAKFTEKTVLQWREMKGDYSYGNSSTVNADAHFNSRTLNDQFTAVYNGSKDSIAEVPFAYDTNKFYLVGDNILVVETPISTGTSYDSAPNYFYINYVQLTNTSSDGSKQVKLKIYDTAGTYLKADGTLNEAINTSRPNADSSWPNYHEGSGSIKYCVTAPTITVNDTAKSDPATITAANIQTLMPTTNGLQAYAEGTTVWTFSHSSQDNRNGSNSTPLGNGVYLYNSYCPYFDLDITPSTAANLRYYKWTNSDTVPASGWNSTSSNKVNVNFPTSGDVSANSVTAKDIYLHVADYAGNVTTKKMSQCQWINETVQDAWPKRKDDTGKKMENGAYYLESDGFYATDIPRLTVTLPAGTSGDVKVYIPTDWFNKVCDNGAPIYGYAMGNHTRYDEGHTDISKAKRDATGPYLEIPQSYIAEATAQSTNYAEFYFYVYDAVGQDLTAVVRVTVDSTPPLLQVNVSPAEAGKLKWAEESSIVELSSATSNYESWRFGFANSGNNTGDAFAIQGGNEMFRRATLNKGFSAANPIVLYSSSNALKVMLYTTTTDILEYKYSINDGSPITLQYTAEHQYISSITIPGTPGTEQKIKFSAIDKGANVTNLYFKVYVDNQGPTISATDVQKVNQITETSGGTSEVVNYFGSQATAKISISDEYAGLSSANGGFSTDSVNLVNDLPEPTSDKSLVISVSDRFGNASNSSMTYNGSNKWVKDTTAPGTPSLLHDGSNSFSTTNSIETSYNIYGSDGLLVSSSGSEVTVLFVGGVSTITVKPNPNASDNDVMGYVSLSTTSTPKTFYAKTEVTDTFEYTVSESSNITRYIYAVDKAGNCSSTPLTLMLKPNDQIPSLQSIISSSGFYSEGSSGWFSEDAKIKVEVNNSPTQYAIGYGHSTYGTDYKVFSYNSQISIPEAFKNIEMPCLWIAFDHGGWSTDYYIKATNGTVTAVPLAQNTVTSWKLDDSKPTGIAVNTVTATNATYYKASGTKIFYNGTESNSKLLITPTASDGDNGSGIKGYSTSPYFSGASTDPVEVSTYSSPTSVTIYAFDNVGNMSEQTISLTKDETPPQVTPGNMTGCTQIGSTWYFKDDSAKLTLSITDTDTGSGVSASSLLKNNDEIKLSDYKDQSGTRIVIPINKIFDNVGNTKEYELVSNIVQDSVAPNPPGSVSYVEATGGKVYVSENTVYYNNSTTAVTLTLYGQSDAASGLDGFVVTGASASAVEGYKTSKISIPTSSLGDSTSITIQAKDGVGNVSSGYTVILKKDASEPSVTISLTEVENSIYKSGSNYYFKNPGSNYAKFTLTITENGVGLDSSSLTSGTYNISDYLDTETHKIKIDSGLIKDALFNTAEYTSSFLVYNDTSAPSIESGNFTVTGNPTIGTESKTSTTPVTWYKSGFKLYIENCESGGSGLAYWQIGTTQTKGDGTYVSSTSEGDTGTITLPATLTTPTVLYIYAEDHLGNSASAKLSTIDSSYQDMWACDTSAAPSAPAISAITSIEAKVGSDTSAGYAHLDSTNSKLYYNTSASAMTITMSSELPGDVIGYNLTGNASSGASTTLDVSTIPSDAIKIYAVDYKGKVSYRLKLTLVKDETAPTFTQPTPGTSVTSAKAPNGYTVNVYAAGTALSIPVSDGDSGSGIAAYALASNVGEGNGYSGYTNTLSWIDATSSPITLSLPETEYFNTNYMLLLKDKVGNITQASGSGNTAYSAAALKNGDNGWWCSIPASPSFSAKCNITGDGSTSMAVTLTGVKVPVSKIEVDATGINDLSGKLTFTDWDGTTKEIDATFADKVITISGGPYLSKDGKITFTLTGTGIALPSCIKLNGDDSLKVTSGFAPSVFAGFRRFGMPDRYLIEDESDTTPGPVLPTERNISVQQSFVSVMNAPAYITEDKQVNFNIGKNMGIVEESRIAPDTVTVGEDVGYNSEAYDTDNLPLQNHAWKAPDGPIFEEEDLALNMVPGSDASGQLFSATDAGGVKDEQKQGLDPALILALLSLCGLGLAAVFIRRRTV
ncbi:MAG: hypothetical protein J6Y69_05680 [Treponema sp.]|nr:hypothetical protein [Treponema sp.]